MWAALPVAEREFGSGHLGTAWHNRTKRSFNVDPSYDGEASYAHALEMSARRDVLEVVEELLR